MIQNLQVITKPQLVKVGALGIKKKVRILTHLLFISKNTVPISDGCFLSPKTPSRFRTAVSMSKNTVLILGNYIPPFKSNFL